MAGSARSRVPDGPRVGRIALRVVTALVGGYAAAGAAAALVARLLPIARIEATSWAFLLSFVLYGAIGLWALHERRLAVAAAAVWGTAAVAGGVALALGVRP
jgi:hypothetical protein